MKHSISSGIGFHKAAVNLAHNIDGNLLHLDVLVDTDEPVITVVAVTDTLPYQSVIYTSSEFEADLICIDVYGIDSWLCSVV